MRPAESVPPVPYVPPGLEPLPRRLHALAARPRRVAYFYERPDDSTFRYRAYNMAQVLNETPGQVSASYFFLDDLDRLDEVVELAHRAVLCRVRYDGRVDRLVRAFRRRGTPVLFDVDDLVVDPRWAHLVVNSLGVDEGSSSVWDYWFAYLGRLGATLALCDGAVTTTPSLAARLAEGRTMPVAVVPNFLNREQLEVSERVHAARSGRIGVDGGVVRLGYFSGSPSHNRDFAIVEPALAALLDEDGRLQVDVVGHLELEGSLGRFGRRVRRLPFHDFLNLQRLLGSVDLNLVPLQVNAFTDCKSELKYFEAAVVGTVTVASPTATYAAAIRDGHTGHLARAHEWVGVLRGLLAEGAGLAAVAARAREDALARYSWTAQRAAIEAALGLGGSGAGQ